MEAAQSKDDEAAKMGRMKMLAVKSAAKQLTLADGK